MNNEAAFRCEPYGDKGMTLRDYFAAKVVNGILANSATEIRPEDMPQVAAVCYAMADAMLKARKNEQTDDPQ